MNIKEMEEKTGLNRANIRYYEEEGLLRPVRSANGYRDYSEDDLLTLQRIRLLRSLDLSLEEIHRLQTGEVSLPESLYRQSRVLEERRDSLSQAATLCRQIRETGVPYQSLDAPHYLEVMEKGPTPPQPAPTEDRIPRVRSPWRRYIARVLDTTFYIILWCWISVLVFRHNPFSQSTGNRILSNLISILLLLLLEPVFLSLLGTTPGKWVLGLSITDEEGRRLNYPDALRRTLLVFWRGLGLNLPIYSWVRLYESYKECRDSREYLEWELDSTLVLKDQRPWRWLAAAALAALLIFLAIGAGLEGAIPCHRGPLTVAQFCDNYNQLARWYGLDGDGYRLNSDGQWVKETQYVSGTVTIYYPEKVLPAFSFALREGAITEVTLRCHGTGDDMVRLPLDEVALAARAFLGGHAGPDITQKELNKALGSLNDYYNYYESRSFTVYGADCSSEISFSGYVPINNGVLWQAEDAAKPEYSYIFHMKLKDH